MNVHHWLITRIPPMAEWINLFTNEPPIVTMKLVSIMNSPTHSRIETVLLCGRTTPQHYQNNWPINIVIYCHQFNAKRNSLFLALVMMKMRMPPTHMLIDTWKAYECATNLFQCICKSYFPFLRGRLVTSFYSNYYSIIFGQCGTPFETPIFIKTF